MLNKNFYKIKKEYFYLFLGLLIYKFILDFVYVNFINKVYVYSNFTIDFNNLKYMYSFILFFLIYIMLPKNNKKVSSIIILLHFMLMILPMFTIYAMKNESTIFLNMVCFCFAIECFFVRKLPLIKVYKTKQSKYIFYAIVAVLSVYVYSSMIVANGIPSLDALNLTNVYNIRKNVNYPFLMNYLVTWQAKVINPMMIAVSYKYNNRKTLILFIGLQFILYLITAHKSYLFIPIAIIIIMYLFNKKNIMSIISFAGVTGCLVSYLLYELTSSLTIASLFIRRLMFVPAQLKYFYFDFISKNEYLLFSSGIIGKIINTKYPYNMRFVNLISYVYYNDPITAANTGYLGTGYANLGFSGIIIYTALITVILIIIDSIGKKLDNSMVVGILLFSMLSLNDSDLLTTLLTGGLLLLIVLLYLYAGIDKQVISKNKS
ncbi:hypothetical protein [Sedimentibacter sp. MB31-C6]|uniref:hypothetical protein n=1 Tax=Sedimentibacter sp. MB31-C6 TaxID=3109366 RepID=UPI002DDCD9DF|nr:hypothetical protein [Sedimentibacter sp. MB36-C1]WSI03566.1 hypothetical protein U8307_10960 [Sedimentibacter sp. MB36-C1]